jgi:adenylate cyclase
VLGVPKDVLILGLALLEVVTLIALVVTVRRGRERDEEIRGLRAELASVPVRAQNAAGWAVKQVVDTATRVRERGLVGGLLMAPLEDLTRWATEDRAAIASVADAEGRVTFLFSDIKNSTSLNETLGDEEWVKVLDAHDRVVRQEVGRRKGHVVKSQGDGFMVVFPSADAAVATALGIQKGMGSAGRRLRRTPVQVRIGIHTGTAIARDGDYFGRNVAKAARLTALADGGQVLVSDETADRLERHRVGHHGEYELKGLTGSHHVWTVT